MRAFVAIASIFFVQSTFADLMTVKDLDDLIARGATGEVAAVSYVQGVVDGMLGIDSLHQKERHTPPEFCRFFDSYKRGKPETHPAYRTKEIVAAWKQQGAPMSTPAVDMVLAYLSAQYSCKR